MTVSLIVGTPKGAAILRSNDHKTWQSEFSLRGWPVTASTRDDQGRTYVAVNSPNYGVALFASDDMKTWTQLESAPLPCDRPRQSRASSTHRARRFRRPAQGRRPLRRPDLDAAFRARHALC